MDQRQDARAVSVALGTYNGEAYVAEQVRSILGQTHPASELVVSDDGSTDRTLAIVDATIAEHRASHPDTTPVVTVLTDGHLGVAGNFERALRACTSPLIAPSDQDDIWEPDRLERMVDALAAAPDALLLHSDALLIGPDGQGYGIGLFEALGVSDAERAELGSGRSFDTFVRRNLATGMTMMFRSQLRDAALPIPDGWIHDEWLAMVAAATGGTIVLDERLGRYRQHGANAIGASKPRLRDLIARLTEPRQPRNAVLLRRAESLVSRLDVLDGVPEEKRAIARAKLAHEQSRSALPAARPARVGAVLRIARTGGYGRFGNGRKDVLRDIVQPGSEPSA